MQKPPSGQEAGFDVVRAVLEEYYDQSKVNLIKLVETAARKESEAEIVQPSLPTSRGRFLTEPVTAQA